jgi:pimeloyl-ACP methyl ester carboxylesterase
MQWESVRSRVFDIVDEIEPDTILLVGHSLGGALATIASTEIVDQYPHIAVDVITFGAPRCGNMAYIKGVANNVKSMTRVVHDSDAVPSTPPLFMSYTHCDGEWMHLQSCCAKPPTGTPFRVVWRTSADVWWREAQMLWRRALHQELGVADHYIERYLEALEQIDSL